MSFQKIKNLWRSSQSSTTSELKQQSSFLEQAQSIISSYRKSSIQSTQQFDSYLQTIPEQYAKFKKSLNQRQQKSFVSLKPQLLKNCYENVSSQFFKTDYVIEHQIFNNNRKLNKEKQMKMHQDLDQVQVCLFNQISSRFDQILSVLRTIQSLQCLVNYNIARIKKIRQTNFDKAKKVSARQERIIKLMRKQKNLKEVSQNLSKFKIYKRFLDQTSLQGEHSAGFYQHLQNVKYEAAFLSIFSSCKTIQNKIQQCQLNLKKSFSDSINDSLYDYVTKDQRKYHKKFWQKFKYRADILQDEKQDNQGTVILDQSTIIQQDIPDTFEIPANRDQQQVILSNLKRGWEQGQYTIGGLKSNLDKYLKSVHNSFTNDFRQMCEQTLKRNDKHISNPCLSNLTQQFTISFFTKCCQYYSTFFRNSLYKLSSSVSKFIKFTLSLCVDTLNIEQKQKLNLMIDGMFNVLLFFWKSVNDKILQVFESKQLVQTIDLIQLKNYIAVIQTHQEFIKKFISSQFEIELNKDSFIGQKLCLLFSKFPNSQIKQYKIAKLLEYLSKMHKNALQIELKDSLQNQIWSPTDIPTFYYDSLHFIITGQSLNLRRNKGQKNHGGTSTAYDTSVLMDSMYKQQSYLIQKKPTIISNFRIIRSDIIIETQNFKITQTVLLMLQIIQDYMLLNQFYPEISQEISLKLSEVFRSYNASSIQLIVHAGAVVLGKIKTKSITAKHLALSTLCIRFCLFVLQSIAKRIKILDYQKIHKDYEDHSQTTIRKLQTILKTKINQSMGQISLELSPSKGTQSIVNSTKILHDILIDYFDKQTLVKIFTNQISRAYIGKISTLKIGSKMNAQALKDDVNFFFTQLKFLKDLVSQFQSCRLQAEDIVRKSFQSL